jgi:hypothetical protein
MIAQGFLRDWKRESLSEIDKAAIENLYSWASQLAIPSSVFAESLDGSLSPRGSPVMPTSD